MAHVWHMSEPSADTRGATVAAAWDSLLDLVRQWMIVHFALNTDATVGMDLRQRRCRTSGIPSGRHLVGRGPGADPLRAIPAQEGSRSRSGRSRDP